MEKKPTITDYLSILFKWKRFFVVNLFIVTISATIISYMIPERFKSSATIMVTQDEGGLGALGGMLSSVGSILGGAITGSGATPTDKIFSYLESRTLLLSVIEKFDLTSYYEIKEFQRDKTLNKLSNDVKFDMTENGLVEVSMIHKNPVISSQIVNFIIKQADSLNRYFSVQYAKNYREFVEHRYFQNLEDIKQLENNLELFQRKYKIYAIPEQLEIAFQAIAKLEGELALKELEQEFIFETQGKNNPSYNLVTKNVELLRKKLNSLEKGEFSTDESIIYFALKDIPKLQREYLKIFRELEVQTKLLEYTLPMYEQAVMEEKKNIPTVMVIDAGIPPQLKNSPKKAFIIISAFMIAAFIFILMIFRGETSLNLTEKNLIEEKEEKFYRIITKIYRLHF